MKLCQYIEPLSHRSILMPFKMHRVFTQTFILTYCMFRNSEWKTFKSWGQSRGAFWSLRTKSAGCFVHLGLYTPRSGWRSLRCPSVVVPFDGPCQQLSRTFFRTRKSWKLTELLSDTWCPCALWAEICKVPPRSHLTSKPQEGGIKHHRSWYVRKGFVKMYWLPKFHREIIIIDGVIKVQRPLRQNTNLLPYMFIVNMSVDLWHDFHLPTSMPLKTLIEPDKTFILRYST